MMLVSTGPPGGPLGALLGHLRRLLGASGVALGSLGPSERSWRHLEAVLEATLGLSLALLGPS
eukprot:608420-Pyramimonas_sp.AAC.1